MSGRVAELVDRLKLQAKLDLEWLLKQPQGRRLLHTWVDHHEWCGVSADPFSSDPLANAYAMGRRSIGVQLNLAMQATDPEMVARMIAEAMNVRREALEAARSDQQSTEAD